MRNIPAGYHNSNSEIVSGLQNLFKRLREQDASHTDSLWAAFGAERIESLEKENAALWTEVRAFRSAVSESAGVGLGGMMEAPEKLKPCPFCGGDAYLLYREDEQKSCFYSVGCPACAAHLSDKKSEQAIKDWNTRASTMPGELVEELYKVASTWLRHIDRQKERAETLTRAASLARKGDMDGARRLKAQVDSAPRVYDGANMEPVMRKFKTWREGKNT